LPPEVLVTPESYHIVIQFLEIGILSRGAGVNFIGGFVGSFEDSLVKRPQLRAIDN
jgi:hypothetical protein